jgi:prepilin-type N-terminal cleavage/methylation domain-containing protein/prepilin-type processing-associated H-X9-DG protein
MPPSRSGFTLLEAVVAITVIAILLAIAIPAVQSARESSRRVECTSHLRELGTALSAYEGSRGRYPDLVRWREQLFPFLDQTPLARALETEDHSIDIRKTTVPIFLCPSDHEVTSGWAHANFYANLGTGLQTFGYNGFLTPATEHILTMGAYGLPHPGRSTRTAEFHDGLSHTAAVSEALISAGPMGMSHDDWREYTSEPRRVIWSADLDLVLPCRLSQLAETCRSLDYDTATEGGASPRGWLVWGQWNDPAGTVTSGEPKTWSYDHLLPPNMPMCVLGSYYGTFPASSGHPGGVNVLYGDGRVEFISDAVDLRVWRGWSNRSSTADTTTVTVHQCSVPVL